VREKKDNGPLAMECVHTAVSFPAEKKSETAEKKTYKIVITIMPN
jgi:hypothetical protein